MAAITEALGFQRLQERPEADLGLAAETSGSSRNLALAAVGRPPHEIAFVSGIGCSSRIPGYTTAYGFNSVHGRALPIAQGIKLANPELLVLVAGGDGDGFSIGGGHLPHAIRRNLDLTYIVMDNQIYGLTKGQLSPTSPRGLATVTSGLGSLEDPVNPLMYVLGYGAGFVAQGTPADMPGLAALIEEGIRFPGFALHQRPVSCVTYGQADQQLKAHKTEMQTPASLEHDPADFLEGMSPPGTTERSSTRGLSGRNPSPGRLRGRGASDATSRCVRPPFRGTGSGFVPAAVRLQLESRSRFRGAPCPSFAPPSSVSGRPWVVAWVPRAHPAGSHARALAHPGARGVGRTRRKREEGPSNWFLNQRRSVDGFRRSRRRGRSRTSREGEARRSCRAAGSTWAPNIGGA
jgi:2-oxoglutarate ferredoxin oxidoreductase subunit beta